MRRYLTPSLIVAASMSMPLTAFAQDCPPGAWFCANSAAAAAPSDVAPSDDDALPPPPVADSLPVPEDDAAPSVTREGRMPPPPVVVYQPRQSASPPPQIIIIAPGRTHVVRKATPVVRTTPVVVRRTRVRTTYSPAVRPVQRRWQSEWGINARFEGVGFGGDSNAGMPGARDAGMGGFGLSLRYRPWARLALDAGFDVIGGTDLNGFERVETPFSISGIFYINPRSRSQLYLTGGVNWSSASVHSNFPTPLLAQQSNGTGFAAEYKYFGGQLGVGLEFRLSKRVSLNVDMLGFVRSRTDIDDGHHKRDGQTSAATSTPEYVNPVTGQTTNTSGGGLFRGGMTLWW